ncbi:hypothetical protein LINPERHAP1_LOCUS14245 [Linum perenne]
MWNFNSNQRLLLISFSVTTICYTSMQVRLFPYRIYKHETEHITFVTPSVKLIGRQIFLPMKAMAIALVPTVFVVRILISVVSCFPTNSVSHKDQFFRS